MRRRWFAVVVVPALAVAVGPRFGPTDPTALAAPVADASPAPAAEDTPPPTTAVPRDALGTGRFVPGPPRRLLDTRTGQGGITGKLLPGQPRFLAIDGLTSLDFAVVLNVTMTDPDGPGWVRVWPSDHARPDTSNVNVDRPGVTVANSVVVPLGYAPQLGGPPTTLPGVTTRFVVIESSIATHVVIDQYGSYAWATAFSRPGRFRPIPPTRLLDERTTPILPSPQRTLQVAGVAPIPASGVSAVALTVTNAENSDSGYVSLWPTGQPDPGTSILNMNGPNDVRANLALTALGTGGKITLATSVDARVVVDVVGWFTDDTADYTSSGLLVTLTPNRRYDSRSDPAGPLLADQPRRLTIPIAGQLGPVQALAVLHNFTLTETSAPGYAVAWADGTPRPGTSNLNATGAGQTRAALAITTVTGGSDNALLVNSSVTTHAVDDLLGYFLP